MDDDAVAARRVIFWTAFAALVFLAGTYLAPLLAAADLGGGDWLHLIYAPVCHQASGRSFAIGEGHQAVCARCAGLYWGGVAGLLAYAWFVIGRRRDPKPVWLLYSLAPTVIDALLPWVGLPGLPSLPRHILAWPPGFVAGLFLAAGITDIAITLQSKRSCGPMGFRSEPLVEESDG
jgi:uncharacterized membrane protein